MAKVTQFYSYGLITTPRNLVHTRVVVFRVWGIQQDFTGSLYQQTYLFHSYKNVTTTTIYRLGKKTPSPVDLYQQSSFPQQYQVSGGHVIERKGQAVLSTRNRVRRG